MTPGIFMKNYKINFICGIQGFGFLECVEVEIMNKTMAH